MRSKRRRLMVSTSASFAKLNDSITLFAAATLAYVSIERSSPSKSGAISSRMFDLYSLISARFASRRSEAVRSSSCN